LFDASPVPPAALLVVAVVVSLSPASVSHLDSGALAAVEPRLWNMATVLAILQDTTIVAPGPSVRNVSLTGAMPVGVVGDAGRWTKAPQ
jgi:hypothetical protein